MRRSEYKSILKRLAQHRKAVEALWNYEDNNNTTQAGNDMSDFDAHGDICNSCLDNANDNNSANSSFPIQINLPVLINCVLPLFMNEHGKHLDHFDGLPRYVSETVKRLVKDPRFHETPLLVLGEEEEAHPFVPSIDVALVFLRRLYEHRKTFVNISKEEVLALNRVQDCSLAPHDKIQVQKKIEEIVGSFNFWLDPSRYIQPYQETEQYIIPEDVVDCWLSSIIQSGVLRPNKLDVAK